MEVETGKQKNFGHGKDRIQHDHKTNMKIGEYDQTNVWNEDERKIVCVVNDREE